MTYVPTLPVAGSLATRKPTKQTVAGVGIIDTFNNAMPGLILPPDNAATLRKARHVSIRFPSRFHDLGGDAVVEAEHVYAWLAFDSVFDWVAECAKQFGQVATN